ncbi:MAG: hypothetical protein GEU26_06470 [Nitrososphaeraceae archaeon]|nr:hypothetical protein [Nitrososphaeraceae archaeon]
MESQSPIPPEWLTPQRPPFVIKKDSPVVRYQARRADSGFDTVKIDDKKPGFTNFAKSGKKLGFTNFYLKSGNSIRLIPNIDWFFNGLYDVPVEIVGKSRPTALEDFPLLTDDEFNSLKIEDAPLQLKGYEDSLVGFYADTFLGAGHWMETRGGLNQATGILTGWTKTQTVTWFGGYHGSVRLVLSKNGAVLWVSPKVRYGIDGTAFGSGIRYDNWTFQVPRDIAAIADRVDIIHSWDPDGLQSRINNLISWGTKILQWAAALAQIAVMVVG